MKVNIVFILATLITLAISCNKDPETPTGGNKILIGATVSDTVSYIFAKVSTQLNGTSGNQISQHGHCWSTESNPDIEDSHNSLGGISCPGKFTSDLTGLSDNTKYFVRSYVTFQRGTIYGIQKEIKTLKGGKPIAYTGDASDLTSTSVKISGMATFDSGYSIIQKGICWDTAANPTLLKSIGHSEEGSEIGSFISSVANLIENKQYYYCAYANNFKGTSYGNIKQFMTVKIEKPTVVTSNVTNITAITAISGGNVTNDGNETVSARGICWSTSSNPTIANSFTTEGSGTGMFVSYLTNLNPNTEYYIRAYATNIVGTSYGNEISFTTLNFTIGQNYGGGIIFYIDGTGSHGLIAAQTDQSAGAQWGCTGALISGTSTAIGTGQANTTRIVNGCNTAGIAARICNDLVLNGYSDWFLPSKDELNQMYLQKSKIGGFANDYYWSSSEYNADYAWFQSFYSGNQGNGNKSNTIYVLRAVRAF